MSSEWYYQLMGEEFGPFSPQELKERAAGGDIGPKSLVRKGKDGEWVSAYRLKGLFSKPGKSKSPEATAATTRVEKPVPAQKQVSAKQASGTNSKWIVIGVGVGVVLLAIVAVLVFTSGNSSIDQNSVAAVPETVDSVADDLPSENPVAREINEANPALDSESTQEPSLPADNAPLEQSGNQDKESLLGDDAATDEFGSFQPMGLKERMVVAAMNLNVTEDTQYHHKCELVGVKDIGDPSFDSSRTATYIDRDNQLILTLSGPSEDLIAIQLTIPLERFMTEADGTAPYAAAWGRCVQRLTAAADPPWVQDLYSWMNTNITQVALGQMALTFRKSLMAKYWTFESDVGLVMSLIIVSPKNQPAEPPSTSAAHSWRDLTGFYIRDDKASKLATDLLKDAGISAEGDWMDLGNIHAVAISEQGDVFCVESIDATSLIPRFSQANRTRLSQLWKPDEYVASWMKIRVNLGAVEITEVKGGPAVMASFPLDGKRKNLSLSWHDQLSDGKYKQLFLQGTFGLGIAASVFNKSDEIEPPMYVLPKDLVGSWKVDVAASIKAFTKFGIPMQSGMKFSEELSDAGWGFEIDQLNVTGEWKEGRSDPVSKQSAVVPWTNGDVAFVLLDKTDSLLPLAIVQRDEWSCDVLKRWHGQDLWVRMSREK